MSLSELSKAQRIEKALEVLALLTQNPKMTQKKACEQVGINPDTYRYWVTQSSDAIESFREAINQIERIEITQILIAKEEIQQKLINDALNKYTDPMARLAIIQYMDHRLDTLADRHRSSDISGVRDKLAGPELMQGENRFGMAEQVIVTAQSDGSVNVRAKAPIVIDAHSQSANIQQLLQGPILDHQPDQTNQDLPQSENTDFQT